MKTAAFVVVLAGAFVAAQSPSGTPSDTVANFITNINTTELALIHLSCKVKSCLKALAPTIATCALAAAQEELGE